MPRGRQTSFVITLTPQDRATLQRWQRSTTITSGQARRGRAILLLAEGYTFTETVRRVGLSRRVVYVWLRRYQDEGLAGLVARQRWDKRKDVA